MDVMAFVAQLDNKDWSILFAQMEKVAQANIARRDGDILYRYLGEIDDPSEMLESFATVKDVQYAGKTNWFVCSDGTFYTCGDAEVDILFESGKVVDYLFPFEIERDEIYNALNKDAKIAFRVKLQGITETEAKEIVCTELGIPAYKNTYVFTITRIIYDDYTKTDTEEKYNCYIEADTEDGAYHKLYATSTGHATLKVGAIISTGKCYTAEDNQKMREMNKSIFNYCGGIRYTRTVKACNIKLTEVFQNK